MKNNYTPEAVGQRIKTDRQILAEAIIERHWELRPDFVAKYDKIGREKCLQDVKYHLDYLSQAIVANSPALFAEYLIWVKGLFAGLKIPFEELQESLEIIDKTLQEELPAEMKEVIHAYLQNGQKQLAQAASSPPGFLDNTQPLGNLAEKYLTALLDGQRRVASDLILEAVEEKTPIKDIYLHVFQQTQREIGRLWQMNQITVAQEHYCTAATQLIMSQLYPYIFTTNRINHSMVAACVGGELHELGIRMVADFFEMEGWDTYYLGANMPTDSIVHLVSDKQADVLAISATMTFNINQVNDLIGAVRTLSEPVKILVGGYPFNLDPELWRQVGADTYAKNASEALLSAQAVIPAKG